jgi:hypothetical protein
MTRRRCTAGRAGAVSFPAGFADLGGRSIKNAAFSNRVGLVGWIFFPASPMNTNTRRKSTALVSLVLVPLNLMGLGFTGCDSRDDAPQSVTQGNGDGDEVVDFDYRDPDDPYTLDPVTNYQGGPTTMPTTQPLGSSGFATMPQRHYGSYSSSYYGGGVHFVPVPYRVGYRPIYRSSPGWGWSSSGYHSSGSSSSARPGVSRSWSGSSSGSSHSSSVSRGGFGSTGHAMSGGS